MHNLSYVLIGYVTVPFVKIIRGPKVKSCLTSVVLILSVCVINPSLAVTVSSGDIVDDSGLIPGDDSPIILDDSRPIPTDDSPIILNDVYDIFVDGNLFLDYSVFSENQVEPVGIDVSFTAETITIFPLGEEPTIPDLSTTTIFRNPRLSISEVGDILLFSDSPISRGVIEATSNISIGDYSELQSVPLPAPMALLLSAIAILGLFWGKPTVTLRDRKIIAK